MCAIVLLLCVIVGGTVKLCKDHKEKTNIKS